MSDIIISTYLTLLSLISSYAKVDYKRFTRDRSVTLRTDALGLLCFFKGHELNLKWLKQKKKKKSLLKVSSNHGKEATESQKLLGPEI